MKGLMTNKPLLISALIEHADQYHGDTAIVSAMPDGSLTTTNYREIHERSKQLADALQQLLGDGDAVIGTIAWNDFRHLEIYFGVSGSGKICHTINPRLAAEQLIYIINQAQDRVLFVDEGFLPIVNAVLDQMTTVELVVVLNGNTDTRQGAMANSISYEDFIAGGNAGYCWPELDETSASSLCYTSGTTSNPKGVLYSHRSTMLHTFAIVAPDCMAISGRDTVMPVVPMFHVNAWGIPYAAAMTGCKLVLPGPKLDGHSLMKLINSESVTLAAGVPTLWAGLLSALKESGQSLPFLQRTIVGGSSCSSSMIEQFRDEYAVNFIHAWGMTEISPVGTVNTPKAKHAHLNKEQQTQLSAMQGRPPFGVELKVVDEHNQTLPNDGKSQGDLMIRGYWVIDRYFAVDNSPLVDGWFHTGDIATLDSDGYMHIRDRSKDIIKSGGEWISSVDLENLALGYVGIVEAAVIAAEHREWSERPVLIVVQASNANLAESDILSHYVNKVPKWWIPDAVVFTEELPRNATGKVRKNLLREVYGKILLETAS